MQRNGFSVPSDMKKQLVKFKVAQKLTRKMLCGSYLLNKCIIA